MEWLPGQVRVHNLQELVYKQGQAGITKASVTIVFNNENKAMAPHGSAGVILHLMPHCPSLSFSPPHTCFTNRVFRAFCSVFEVSMAF